MADDLATWSNAFHSGLGEGLAPPEAGRRADAALARSHSHPWLKLAAVLVVAIILGVIVGLVQSERK